MANIWQMRENILIDNILKGKDFWMDLVVD